MSLSPSMPIPVRSCGYIRRASSEPPTTTPTDAEAGSAAAAAARLVVGGPDNHSTEDDVQLSAEAWLGISPDNRYGLNMVPARPALSSRQPPADPPLPSHRSARTLVFESPAPKEIGSFRRRSRAAGPAVPSRVGLPSVRFLEIAKALEAHRTQPPSFGGSRHRSPPSPEAARVIRRRFEETSSHLDPQLECQDPLVPNSVGLPFPNQQPRSESTGDDDSIVDEHNERLAWLSSTCYDHGDDGNDMMVPPGWTDSEDEPEPLAPGEAPQCCNCRVELPMATQLFQCRDGRRRWFCRSCPSPSKPYRRQYRVNRIGLSPRVFPQRC